MSNSGGSKLVGSCMQRADMSQVKMLSMPEKQQTISNEFMQVWGKSSLENIKAGQHQKPMYSGENNWCKINKEMIKRQKLSLVLTVVLSDVTTKLYHPKIHWMYFVAPVMSLVAIRYGAINKGSLQTRFMTNENTFLRLHLLLLPQWKIQNIWIWNNWSIKKFNCETHI